MMSFNDMTVIITIEKIMTSELVLSLGSEKHLSYGQDVITGISHFLR